MQIMLGEKIKELRKRDGRKQDDMAAALGVTGQAISRWESDKGYPDMEMIPAIANYFHVTIDELFGYDNDRNVRLSECLKKADAMVKPGFKETKESVRKWESFLREALAEFPNEWKLQFRLAMALQAKSHLVDKSQKEKTESLRESAELLKQAKSSTEDPRWKDSIAGSLARIYYNLKDETQVEKIASECSSAYVCREVILTDTPNVDKAKEYLKKALLSLLHEAAFISVKNRMDDHKPAFSDNIELYLSLARAFEGILTKGKYGFFNVEMCFLYLHASYLSAKKEKEKETLKYFDKAYESYLGFKDAWDRKASYGENVGSDYPGLLMFIDENVLRNFLSNIPKAIADKIRNSPKYKSVL